jgi:hypothetical protein
MTAQQHSLSLPLRIFPIVGTSLANIYEANGLMVFQCDIYDAPQIVCSVNAFPSTAKALRELIRAWDERQLPVSDRMEAALKEAEAALEAAERQL